MSAKQKKYNIAIIRQKYSSFGGAEKIINTISRSLNDSALSLTIISRAWPESNHSHDGIKHVTCNPFYLGRTWRNISFEFEACSIIRAMRTFDIIQSHERVSCCNIFRAGDGIHRAWLKHHKKSSGISKLFSLFSPFHAILLNREKRMFHSARLQAVIAPSAMIATEISEYFPETCATTHVIHNPIDLTVFNKNNTSTIRHSVRQELNIDNDVYLLIFIGSGYARKGLEVAINALKKLPNNVLLLVVGKDKDQKKYEKIANKNMLSSRTLFLGAHESPERLLKASDLLLLPATYEPFGNVALEASACGIPALISKKTGVKDLFEDCSRILELDFELWAKKILALYNSGDRKPSIPEEKIEQINKTFPEKMHSLYTSLLGTASQHTAKTRPNK
jgi:UDP-glucose:(heptosyl)LPS alpha-1,3-glucosyltransferase